MFFEATIRRPGYLFDNWYQSGRKAGFVSGVEFRWNGTDYQAVETPLSPESVNLLLPNPRVRVALYSGTHKVDLHPYLPDIDAAMAELTAKSGEEPAAQSEPVKPESEPVKQEPPKTVQATSVPAAPASPRPAITKLTLKK